MAIYSLIQYTTTVLSQKFLQYPGDLQYLYWDLALNFFFILFIGNTKTAGSLTPERPRSSLFSVTNVVQMIIIFGIQAAGQISMIAIFQRADPDYYGVIGGMDNAQTNYNDAKNSFTLGL
jgi:magnesium-transporting ATPase (P-type)